MQITFIPKEYGEELSCNGIDSIPPTYLKEILFDFEILDETSLQEVNCGTGFDWIWLLLTVNIASFVLDLGDKINGGLDGWIGIAEKLKKLIKKSSHIKLDKDALTALCINNLLKKIDGIESIEKIIEEEIPLGNLAGMIKYSPDKEFASKINSYYIIAFKINNEFCYLYGAYLNGEIELLKSLKIEKPGV